MLSDLGAYGSTQLRRVARKASQRLLGKSKFYTVGAFAADAPGYMVKLRESEHLPVALRRLKTADLLSRGRYRCLLAGYPCR